MTTLLLLLIVIVLLVVITLFGERRVPWASKLRRLHPGKRNQAEWMAPDDVVEMVQAHYQEAVFWLQDATLATADDGNEARFLSGAALTDYVRRYERNQTARIVGVLRAQHCIAIRHFEESGEQCLLIDTQTDCHIASYDLKTGRRLTTQRVPDDVYVYRMQYDRHDKRWKIREFVQTLPYGWQTSRPRVRLQSELRLPAGRDY